VLFDDAPTAQFTATALVEEDLFFICKAGSSLAPRTPTLSLREALASTLILPARQHGVRPLVEQVAQGVGLVLRNVLEINSIAILRSAILADLGATLLPRAPLQDDIAHGAMQAWAVVNPAVTRKVILCGSRNIPLTNAAAAISRLVRDVTEDLCARQAWPGARLAL
jgi:LysR family nitrogen assimilation transcriptional regulator